MARQQLLHELTQRVFMRLLQNKMTMIRHQAKAKFLDPDAVFSLQPAEIRKLRYLKICANRAATIAATNNVLSIHLLSSGNSRHASLLACAASAFQ
jgi:hypothetical protein